MTINLLNAPTDLNGLPYVPAKDRSWMTDAMRADFARQFDCPASEVECRLDARDAMHARLAEHREYDDPFGYQRGRDLARHAAGRGRF